MNKKLVANSTPKAQDIRHNLTDNCEIIITARRVVDIPNAPDTVYVVSAYTQNHCPYYNGVLKDMCLKYGDFIETDYLKSTPKKAQLGDITYIPAAEKTPHLIYFHTLPRLLKEQDRVPNAIINALQKSAELLAGQPQLQRIVIPLLGTSINNNLSADYSIKLILHNLYLNREKLQNKQIIIAVHKDNDFLLQNIQSVLDSQEYRNSAVLNTMTPVHMELKDFTTAMLLSSYHTLVKENYIKNLFSILIPNNNNSTEIVPGLGIDIKYKTQEPKIPHHIHKLNFRSLLTAKLKAEDGLWELTLYPRVIRQANGTKTIHLINSLTKNGEEVEELDCHTNIYEHLTELIINSQTLNGQELLHNLESIQPLNTDSLPRFGADIARKVQRFQLAHFLIQESLLKSIRNYMQQLAVDRSDLPVPTRIAAALTACLNEAFSSDENTLRVIENISYIADYILGQNIRKEKLHLGSAPLALISEYFTLEDILQIAALPEAGQNLVFVSAWEPGIVPQETKLNSKIIRNDDAQELCSLLGLDYYISDETVSFFQSQRKSAEQLVLTISNDEPWHNETNTHTYTGATFIITTPPEVKLFTDTYNAIFRSEGVNISSRELVHKRRQLLGEIYNKIVRRMLTNHYQYDSHRKILDSTPQEYADLLRKVLSDVIPQNTILSKTDEENIQSVIEACIQKALIDQGNYQNQPY